MKFKRLVFSSIILSILALQLTSLPKSEAAGANSTLGKEFFITFNANAGSSNKFLYLSGPNNADVTITWPDGSTSNETVTANQITTVNATTQLANYVNTGSDVIAAKSAKIVATEDITVYGLNNQTSTSDAFVAIPTESLDKTYRALSWPTTIGSYPARFSIIAVESGTTTVTITPKNAIATSPGTAGVAYTKTLTQGQVYTATSLQQNGSDISGTLISADKKIAVHAGVDCVNVVTGACDHIVEQMVPTVSWGKSVILPGTINTSQREPYRVIANEDNTELTLNGSVVATIDAGEVHQFTGSSYSNGPGFDVLEANKPIMVAQFLPSGSYSDGVSTQTGDPAMIIMVPTLQFMNRYTVATPATGFSVNAISLVVKTSEVGVITNNGVAIPSNKFVQITGTDYSVGRITVSPGSYTFNSTSGFGVYTYGFNSADSYAYPGGFAIVDLIANPGGVAEVEAAPSPSPTPTASETQPAQPTETVAAPAPAVTPTPTPTRTRRTVQPTASPTVPTPTPSVTEISQPVVIENITGIESSTGPQRVVEFSPTGLPQLLPNQSIGLENGLPIPVRLIPNSSQSGLQLIGENFNLEMNAVDENGQPIPLDENGRLEIEARKFVRINGTGFAPNSTIYVWIFSDPTELGSVITDSSGAFSGQLPLTENLEVGNHTLQLNGLSADDQLRSVSIGVVLAEEVADSTSGFSVWYLAGFIAAAAAAVWIVVLLRKKSK